MTSCQSSNPYTVFIHIVLPCKRSIILQNLYRKMPHHNKRSTLFLLSTNFYNTKNEMSINIVILYLKSTTYLL